MATTYLRLRSGFDEKESLQCLEVIRVDETEETDDFAGKLQIRIRYVHGPRLREFSHTSPTFGASFEKYSSPSARITNGGFFIDPPGLRGRGIGSYVLFRIVRWLQQHVPEAVVQQVVWAIGGAVEDNIIRRAKVYEHAGLVFNKRQQEGIADAVGASRPMLVSELVQIPEDRRLQEVDIVAELNETSARAEQAESKLRQVTAANTNLRCELERARTVQKYCLCAAVSGIVIIFLILRIFRLSMH